MSSANVSQVAFVLAAVAFLSLFSLSLGSAASSSLFSGAALSARLAVLCGFVTTKKALFVLSNAIFLLLAADCRCFFPAVCNMATLSAADDVVTASELPSCAVQVEPSGSYSGDLCYGSNTECVSANCSAEQGEGEKVTSQPEPAQLEGDEENIVALETTTCCRVAAEAEEELERLQMDELNMKFEDFIRNRRIKWLKEEEVLQCQQQQV